MLTLIRLALGALLSVAGAAPSWSADYPAPKAADWIAHDFKFRSGDTMPELRVHYFTIGDPAGAPVLMLHGTGGSGVYFLAPALAGELFGPGQPLDASKYYIIAPDAIGAGGSSKPSDGARMTFPRYDYEDMIAAQYRLLSEGLGVKHLRAVIGNSMGGMETWMWGELHPESMDALVPMAATPAAMSGRNCMTRRLLIETIKSDPEWNGGDYKTQPRSLKWASAWMGLTTSGGTRAYYQQAPNRAAADKLMAERLAAPAAGDANDTIYQYDASRDYDPEPKLGDIKAAVLAINAADDERNPVEPGLMERLLAKIPGARLHLIPASAETRGHGTTGMAKVWKEELRMFLATAARRGS